MTTSELADRAIKRAENDRRLDGVFVAEDFRWTHLPCGGSVVRQDMGTVNSDKYDSASGDPKPIFRFRLHCNIHSVSSAIEEILGE